MGSGVTAGGQGQESWCSSLRLKAWCLPVLVRVPLENSVALGDGTAGAFAVSFPLSSSACPGVRLSGHEYIQAKVCSFFFFFVPYPCLPMVNVTSLQNFSSTTQCLPSVPALA